MTRSSKRIVLIVVAMIVAIVGLAVFAGCGIFSKGDNNAASTPTSYTLQYTDDAGTHTVTVEAGMPYSISSVPSRTGYVFNGLFDAEVGGTQYVSSSGASLAPFTDNKNMVLFPQFTAKQYRVVLDYQGAAVTGSRQLTVEYGTDLPELPKNLSLDHKVFVGWFTEANCGGTQIADQYGLLPIVSTLNDTNFDLSEEIITLYAGFEYEKFTVTCCYDPGMPTENLQIEYDTPAGKIVGETRKNGNAPISWSKTPGGEEFTGRITGDTVLYALEYAPVIEFDANGGNKVSPLVARAGTTIELPEPTKSQMRFENWLDDSGNVYVSTVMPSESISLTAKWLPMLIFEENGGTTVADIATEPGSAIVLPTTTKDNYVFAGWYNGNEKYVSTTMPTRSIVLTAKYWKIAKETIVIVSDAVVVSCKDHDNMGTEIGPITLDYSNTLDLSSIFNGEEMTVKVTAHYKSKHDDASSTSPKYSYLNWYNTNSTSEAYLVWSFGDEHADKQWHQHTRTTQIVLTSPKLYICRYGSSVYHGWSGWTVPDWTDFWVEVEYPDMSTLY